MAKKDVFQQKKEVEVDIMAAVKILRDEQAYAREMQAYVKTLKKQSRESSSVAKRNAINALKKTGVINSNGSAKVKIVSWE